MCEDWRSRADSWNYARIALELFRAHQIPVERMGGADELIGNPQHDNSRYCFSLTGELYLVYLPEGGSTGLDLSKAPGTFTLAWFNPREGGALRSDSTVDGGRRVPLTAPSADDWLAVVRRR
jgi:hypothetical protein